MSSSGPSTEPGLPSGHATAVPPAADPEGVRAALGRILASPLFSGAERLSRFLRFAVEQVLDGHGDRLKEYVLGVEVFDRDERYDPRLDSIVRVEARRLRSKLAEYYASEGAADPIVIELPKGSYVPRFNDAFRGGRPDCRCCSAVVSSLARLVAGDRDAGRPHDGWCPGGPVGPRRSRSQPGDDGDDAGRAAVRRSRRWGGSCGSVDRWSHRRADAHIAIRRPIEDEHHAVQGRATADA